MEMGKHNDRKTKKQAPKVTCITCLKTFDEEGWDPMGGDCPIVQDSTGKIITPNEEFSTIEEFRKKWPEY
jgi:hypothetical protein